MKHKKIGAGDGEQPQFRGQLRPADTDGCVHLGGERVC